MTSGFSHRKKFADRGGSTLRQGAGAPRFTCCPQIQKLADVISEVQKCAKIQIFHGFASDPAVGAYRAPPDPLTNGKGLAVNDRFQM